MRYLAYILLFLPLAVRGQTTYKILADSTRLGSVGNTGNELIIENDTRDTLGVIANSGAGRTSFKALRLQQLTDSTFRLLLGTTAQGQTITIRGTGGGGGATYTLTLNATRDSLILTGSNGSRYAVRDSSGVPYTGAVTDVDLGNNNLSAKSLIVTGTNGNGHIHLKHQASDATSTASSTTLFANSAGDIKYKNDNLYYTTFKTSGNTADREYRFPDSSGTVALLSNLSNIYTANGNINKDVTREVTLNDTAGTLMFVSDKGDKGISVGDSLIFWYGQGESRTGIDGATMYKTYIDTLNNEGYTAFHNVYDLGATTLSYSGMRELNDGSDHLFGVFHTNGQTGAGGYYGNWGYTNPVTEEVIGLTLNHGGAPSGFNLMPFDSSTGYTFKQDNVFRIYDTLRNVIFKTDVDGNIFVPGRTTDNAADTIMMVENDKLVLRPVSTLSGGNTIYTANDALTGDRTVDGATNDLYFENNGFFVINETDNAVSTNDIVTGIDPKVAIYGWGGKTIGVAIDGAGGNGVAIVGNASGANGVGVNIQGGGGANADAPDIFLNGSRISMASIPEDNTNTTLLTRGQYNFVETRTLASLEYVDSIYRIVGKDSLFYTTIDGRTLAIKDSTGGGSSGLTKGTTTIASSASKNILYDSSGTLSASPNFAYDFTNNRVGIGVNAPTGTLHLKAGTSSASGAPLKFTSGTNLTTQEAGAIEYDGTSLHITFNNLYRSNIITTDNAALYNTYSQASKNGAAFTSGSNNVLLGRSAGSALTDGLNNIFIGGGTGSQAASHTYNVGIGIDVLLGTSSAQNVGIGAFALRNCGAANGSNVAVGYYSGYNITSGVGNTALGYRAGDNITTGGKNIIIGYDVDAQSATTSGQMSIANLIFGTGIGDSLGTKIETGAIGIRVAAPTASLHIATGTATANTAPLKIETTSAALLGTPEAGALEVLSDTLYYTGSSASRYQVTKSLYGSATLDFGSTNAQNSADLTIGIAGAADGDVVALGVPNVSVNANSSFSAWVSATNVVTVRFNNYSSGSIDPASGTFKVRVVKN